MNTYTVTVDLYLRNGNIFGGALTWNAEIVILTNKSSNHRTGGVQMNHICWVGER